MGNVEKRLDTEHTPLVMPLVCPFRVRQGTSPKLLVTQRGARFMRSAAVQALHLITQSVTPNTLTRYASFCRANWSSIVV